MVSTSLRSRVEWSGVPPLPAQLTSLVGRNNETTRVVGLLGDASIRLVTLSGPGGVGKTRLALQVAGSLEPSGNRQRNIPTPFPAGVGFVPLAPISDPRLVAATIARSLQTMHDDVPAFDAIVDAIGSRRILLVLDNFEQVAQSAPLVTNLLTACPGLKIMATSRSLLRVTGEYDVRVAPLDFPSSSKTTTLADLAHSDAAQLFMKRSRALFSADGLSDDDAPAIAEICARLDGLPLAIELAAARVAVLSPAMLAERLDRSLPLLTGGPRDLPARQQTLRGAIAWSDDLLLPDERCLFHRLAVFSGGFTLEAATALLSGISKADGEGDDSSLTASAIEHVTSLMGHSLLVRLNAAGGVPRFSMLGTLREYAIDCLRSEDNEFAASQQHATYILGISLGAMAEFSGPDQRLWLERIEVDHDNVRAALAWAMEHDPELAVRLSSALWRFWEIRGYLLEGQAWLERALATQSPVPDRLRATGLNNLGTLTYRLADYARARNLYEQSLNINRTLNDRNDIADSLNNLGVVASAQGDYDAARSYLEESLDLRRQEQRSDHLSLGLHNLGELEIESGNPARSVPLLEEALALRRRRKDDRGAAYVQYNLGRAALAMDNSAAGESGLRESLATFRDVGEKIGMADSLMELGLLALQRQNGATAVKTLEEGLRLRFDLGDKRGCWPDLKQ